MTHSDMTGRYKDRLTSSEGSVLSRALADRADDVRLRLGPCATSAMRNETRQYMPFEAMAAAILPVVLTTDRVHSSAVQTKRDFN